MTPLELSQLQNHLHQTRATWSAQHNFLLELAPDVRRVRLGALPPEGLQGLADREKAAAAAFAAAAPLAAAAPALPTAVDWRHHAGHNYVSAVKDQGQCGSCVAFGTSAAIDARMRIVDAAPIGTPKGHTLQDVSEAQLFFCSAGYGPNHTCETGWWPAYAYEYAEKVGLAPEACFPYMAHDQPCNLCQNWKNELTVVKSIVDLKAVQAMKAFLANNGPLSTCMSVYSDFFAYHTGVYRHTAGQLEGGHCICCIGYSDTLHAWLCKNSWGPTWGMGGYFWIGYGQCGIDHEMWGVESFTKIYRT